LIPLPLRSIFVYSDDLWISSGNGKVLSRSSSGRVMLTGRYPCHPIFFFKLDRLLSCGGRFLEWIANHVTATIGPSDTSGTRLQRLVCYLALISFSPPRTRPRCDW